MHKFFFTKKIFSQCYTFSTIKSPISEPSILYHNEPGICKVTLNRPKSYNALEREMLISLTNEATNWNINKNIKVVLLKGTGKAFCAGANLKTFYQWKTSGLSTQAQDYFRMLNHLCYLMATLNPFLISLWDGTVMGAGVGISVHSKIKIVTEKAIFGVPQVRIGYWGDIGSGYFLPKLRNNIGYYLGLTGKTLKGEEIVQSGLAQYFVKHDNLKFLEEELIKNGSNLDNIDKIHNIIEKYQEQVDSVYPEEDRIKRYFSNNSLETIWTKLENCNEEDKPWAQRVLTEMKDNAPLGMKLTFNQLKKGSKLGLKENYDLDLIVNQKLVKHPDFTEGIRCVVIDKKDKPKWTHESIFDVKEDEIVYYFS